jgi:hypothetical protein
MSSLGRKTLTESQCLVREERLELSQLLTAGT